MELNDFLTAQLARAAHVAWLGLPDDRFDATLVEPIADVVLTADLDVVETTGQDDRADALSASGALAADVATLMVLSGEGTLEDVLSSETREVLAVRPTGARSAVISDEGPCDVQLMGEALAAAGQHVVHVAHLDGGLGGSGAIGVSLERASADTVAAGTALAQANVQRLRDSPLATSVALSPETLEARSTVHRERALRREAEARVRRLDDDLATAKSDLARLRRSASVQLGRAVASALRDPRHGVPALPGRTRTIFKDRKARGPAGDGTVPRTGAPSPGSSASVAPRRPPIPVGRNRQFEVTLPDSSGVGDSRFRREGGPSKMSLDVPFSFFIPLRLERDGLAGYEPETLAWWLALCDMAGDGVVWDVGANTGLFAALAAAATTREVVAFEPTPDLALWARVLAAENRLDYAVEQVAASDVDGNATFFLSDSTDSSSSLSEGFRKSTHQLDVVTERLETYQRRTGEVPAVIKVDTETTEPAVLRGASSVVLEHRPWILCEVLANCGVEDPLMELVEEWGYRWYHLTEEIPPPAPERIRGDETFTYFMYLLAPAEVDEDLLARVRAWRAALEQCTPR